MIRKASKEDLINCSELIQTVIGQVNAKYYSPEIILAWQEYNALLNLEEEIKHTDFIVYEEKGAIVGVGAIEGAHIKKIYVSPNYQGKGLGKVILESLEQRARENGFVECELNSTINALNFYKRFGYEEKGPFIIEKNELSVTFTRMTKRI
ncbi:MAG: GNAT family N-acetyltransferase [Candidatus Nanoarchaeia archaeon]|nr:GNAT family N-acetyltransferase [Candidatus Nanoarchaeia archaeon]